MTKRHLPLFLIGLLLIVAVFLSVFTKESEASKNKPTGSITLVLVNDKNDNGVANWGDTVRFNVSTTATYPFVNVNCYQNTVLVAVGWAGYFEGALGTGNFGLYSPQWTSGAALCSGDLYEGVPRHNEAPIASTAFSVDA